MKITFPLSPIVFIVPICLFHRFHVPTSYTYKHTVGNAHNFSFFPKKSFKKNH